MWLVALLHEIPQEIGDFSILINSGLEKKKALVLNFLSSLTFLLGMLLVFGLDTQIDISFLIPIAAGNFIYIAASDLIPEIKEHPKISQAGYHLLALSFGLILLLLPYLFKHHH
jgi:zinc and cadmium transporter